MNTPRIESALKEIEASLPDCQAQVRFDVYGGGIDESFIRGSRAGIARLGVRLIRAAIGEEKKKSLNGAAEVSGALDDVIHPDSDERFDWIEIDEDLASDPKVQIDSRRRRKKESWIGWFAVPVVVLAVVLAAWILK